MSLDASESRRSGRSRAFAFSGQANQREGAHGPCPWPSEEDPSWLFEDDSITLGKPPRRREQLAGERSHESYSRLLEESIIFLGTYIDDVVASLVCAQMTHLESENPDKDINIYINSPGGDVSSLFAIYDTSQYIRNDITTVCLGEASGAAAVLLAAGTSGKRMALPNAQVLLCQPYGPVRGQAADINQRAREVDQLRQRIERITAHHTGQDPERIRADTERDIIMDAEAAEAYGVIDQVITSHQGPGGDLPGATQ